MKKKPRDGGCKDERTKGKTRTREEMTRKQRKRRGRKMKNEEKIVAHSRISLRVVLAFGNQLYTLLHILPKEDRQFGSG
jgi:hypothetical protein